MPELSTVTCTFENKTIDGGDNTLQNIPQSAVTGLVDGLAGKQDTLVSGTNIKTINGESVLGSGDLEVTGGGSGSMDYGKTYAFTAGIFTF